ncbi:hypothetical protein H4582DRAFT_464758 [Lactarius indigo]|nr:hypothetical protein H4582DRAFT_464758 [Lactarius indigo]
MTDWQSPAVITADYFAFVKLVHVMTGIFIWEFVVYLEFEYSFFTGKRKFRPSFLLYLGTRWFPLFVIIDALVGLDSVNRINCQAIVTFGFLFSHLSIISASALIVLRIAAIWGLNKIAMSIASITWLVHTGSLIHSVAVVRATWSGGICKLNPSETRTNIPVALITDLVLLVLMLIGLLRWENAHQRGGVWWLLYTQGLVWMVFLVVAEALITVFVLLNLNDPMNKMFQIPALITMTICASRMYRGLADYFLHNEANVDISASLSKPIRFLAPRSGQSSLALGTSGEPDGHTLATEPLPPLQTRRK